MTTINLTPQHGELLLAGQLSKENVRPLLRRVGFEDWQAAYLVLQRMARVEAERQFLARSLPTILMTIGDAASPDRVLINLERLARRVADRLAFFQTLAENPRAVEILITLVAGSQFLTEILLSNPEYFERLVIHRSLAQLLSPNDFYTKAQNGIKPFTEIPEQLDALRRFQRWQLLRLGACDLLGLLDLVAITAQLSHLADSLVQMCLSIAALQTDTDPTDFAVLGMGKLGGEELNYSSDIDLLFLAEANASYYERLGKRLIEGLTRVSPEGFLYRVDMRLRPWGSAGALVTSISGHVAYLTRHAQLWEKQALLKARVIAGNNNLGDNFLKQIEPLIFAAARDVVQADVRAMKERIEQNLQRRGRKWGEVKLGQGSIRDIEFVTQFLQLAHGDTHPEIRSPNTLDSLSRLATAGFLSTDEYRILADGYTFLRPIEHWLQMMHYRQTHTLPTDNRGLNDLARRLGFQNTNAGEEFLARYEQHTIAIRMVYQAYLEEAPVSPSHPVQSKDGDDPILEAHLARLPPEYPSTFSRRDVQRHAFLASRLTDTNLVEVEAIPLEDRRWQVTIVGYDYLGELSLICGLFFSYGLNILEGHVFTYHSRTKAIFSGGRRKIFDVFIVNPIEGNISMDFWAAYAADLSRLLQQLEAGERGQAQGDVAKRLAAIYQQSDPTTEVLYPVDIEIDNTASESTTMLRIESRDTIGFLYELTNALALRGLYIARVLISTTENRVQDTLYITDSDGHKITDPTRQRELRAATVLTKHFTHLLPHSPNPESALLQFRQFLQKLFESPTWPDDLTSLERPEVLEALARLLGVSEFLWTDFFRMQYANLFPLVRDVGALAAEKSKLQLQQELDTVLQEHKADASAQRAALNTYKDHEMFRIDMRHILGHTLEFGQFSAELTALAEVVVETAYQLCCAELTTHFGTPMLGQSETACPMTVCALGKCGGQELGFASDIELVFIYKDKGQTTGPSVIPTAEYYERLVAAMLSTIQAKREGVFELDLRLRPYGRAGSLAVPLESFRTYYAAEGPAWAYERQALIKLRPIAGDTGFGREIVALRDDIVYSGQPFDSAAMRGMRERQVRHLVTPGTINAKHSPGGLVDVEYLVQALQISYGYDNPSLRLTSTRDAMTALHTEGFLSPTDYSRLHESHIFLRRLINALRMVHGNAKDLTIPPTESEAFAFLARRLDYGRDVTGLREDLIRHTTQVQDISSRLLD